MEKQTNNYGNNKTPVSSREGGFLYSFLVISIIFVSLFYSIIVTVAFKGDLSLNANTVLILNYLTGPIAITIAIGILRYKVKRDLITPLLQKKFNKNAIVPTVLICFGLVFGLSEVNSYFVLMLENLGLQISTPALPSYSLGNVFLVVIIVCVLPSIVEEFAFRGIILSGLENAGKPFAILLSGVLFSLFHMSPAQTVYQFIVGVVYALIVLKGGNVVFTMILHFANNLFIVLNYYYFNLNFEGAVKIVIILLALISLAIGVLLLIKNDQPTETVQNQEKSLDKKIFLLASVAGILASGCMWLAGLL